MSRRQNDLGSRDWHEPRNVGSLYKLEEASALCICLVLQRNRKKKIHKEIYYKEFSHMVIEAEKSQDLQSASWRDPGVWMV